MFENLKGKRLLFLGATLPYCELIEYCHEMGVYAIVTDYYEDSPAKKVADESHMVSITDVEAVIKLCKQVKADGIFVAYMDFMLPIAREICDRMGYSFYATKEQIELSHNKRFFKSMCLKYGVPTPLEYTEEIETNGFESKNVKFPVIIKPVDSGGGKGIKICNTPSELKEAYDYAMSFSPSKRVVIEEYVVGEEVTATYTIKNGEVSLSLLRDKLLSYDHPGIQSQGDILLNPSSRLNAYMRNVNPYVKRLLEGVGATDGSVFFQGVAQGDRIVLWEMGYRPNSALDYRHISAINGINYMKMMIAHALTGEMGGYDISMDNPYLPKFSITFNIWAHPGYIGEMCGLEDVQKIENVQLAEFRHPVGYEISEDRPYMQGVFRAIIVDDDVSRIQNTILKIQSLVKVNDTNGNNMLYKPFDIHRLDSRYLPKKEEV